MRERIDQPGQRLNRYGELSRDEYRNLQKTSLVWPSPNTLPIIRSKGWL